MPVPLDDFTIDRFMAQLHKARGMLESEPDIPAGEVEAFYGQMVAIYNSMNRFERLHPDVLDGDRRYRIAKGAGTGFVTVCEFLKSFEMSRRGLEAVRRWGEEQPAAIEAVPAPVRPVAPRKFTQCLREVDWYDFG